MIGYVLLAALALAPLLDLRLRRGPHKRKCLVCDVRHWKGTDVNTTWN